MTDPAITLEEHPDPADQYAVIEGLRAFNRAIAGDPELTPFSIFLRANGRVEGGLIAHLSWRWLYVEKFWIAAPLRGQGHGSALLRRAEAFALERGCHTAHLDTLEFQALPFYERHGYAVWGVLEGYPPGFRQYFLRKPLTPRAPDATDVAGPPSRTRGEEIR